MTRVYNSRSMSRKWLRLMMAMAAGCVSVEAAGEQVAFDDFSNTTLEAFVAANTSVGDGTDWSKTIPGWTIDNPAGIHEPTTAEAYNGWSAMDVDSWISEQGNQEGRVRMRLGLERNTALIADPDAWDDYPPPGKSETGYTSYISTTYDLGIANRAALVLSLDYDFVAEDWQRGIIEVTTDDPTSPTALWQTLLDFQSANYGAPAGVPNNTIFTTNPEPDQVASQKSFASGTDFTVPAAAATLTVRIGCVNSGNDWWFAVDNVLLTDGGGFNNLNDFEGVALSPFPAGGVGSPPGDGTDFTANIPNWTVDNSGMLTVSNEPAFQGWRALDVQSWINQQGGQGRSFFNEPSIFGDRNTVLVADSDAHDDFDVELPPDDPNQGVKEFNSYISRTYDLKNFRNTTLRISFDWEFRAESSQRGIVEASFNGGASWVTLLDLDSDDPAKIALIQQYLYLGNDHYATFDAAQSFQFGGAGSPLPAENSNKMILRIGKVDAQNNWWFAVDNILVEAEPQNFVLGDADGSGNANFGDINPFILALQNQAAYTQQFPNVNPDQVLDFNADGDFTFADINGMIYLLNNP